MIINIIIEIRPFKRRQIIKLTIINIFLLFQHSIELRIILSGKMKVIVIQNVAN